MTNQPDDPFTDPDVQAWARRVRDDLVPKLASSAVMMTLVPDGDADVKIAVELGFSILLDKPIIAVVQPGTRVPDHLVRVADAIIEYAPDDPQFGERISSAIRKLCGDR
jgi:hypothetical protein